MWLVLLPLWLGKAPGAPPPVDPRSELAWVKEVLYENVERVSRTSAIHLMGMGETCRAYHVKGLGAFFVLAPRALPVRGGTQILSFESGPLLPEGLSDERALEIRAERQAAREVRKDVAKAEKEIRAIEEQAREFQKEAQRAHEEADRLFEAQLQELQKIHGNKEGVSTSMPMALPPGTPPGPPAVHIPPPPPGPPWEGWFIGEERSDPRPAQAIVRDVENAVTLALEASAEHLTILAPDELVIVAVDFYPQGPFGLPVSPVRTVVVRAKKKDLTEGSSGKISAEELQKRIEYIQY
jgi:hypothetical protein